MNIFEDPDISEDINEVEKRKLERAKVTHKGSSDQKGPKAKTAIANVFVAPLPMTAEEIKERERRNIAILKEKKSIQQKVNQLPSTAIVGVKDGPLAGELNQGDNHPRNHSKREFDRHSGTGRGKEVSKRGAGGMNWGSNDGKQALNDTFEALKIATNEQHKEDDEDIELSKVMNHNKNDYELNEKITLEEYEEMKRNKRHGKGFEELKPRKELINSEIEGKPYRKPKNTEDAEVLIKVNAEQPSNHRQHHQFNDEDNHAEKGQRNMNQDFDGEQR